MTNLEDKKRLAAERQKRFRNNHNSNANSNAPSRSVTKSNDIAEAEAEAEAENKQITTSGALEQPSAPPPVALLTFPTAGKVKTWALLPTHLQGWKEAYPALDLMAECRKALAWVIANKAKQKTARGMPAFLVNWFNRAQNNGAGNKRTHPDDGQCRYGPDQETAEEIADRTFAAGGGVS
jgi:hypothetical protein